MTGKITGGVTYHIDNMFAHYLSARERHPYFCDWIGPDKSKKSDVERVKKCLGMCRQRIAEAIERRNIGWDDILDCKVWEVFEALVNGDTAHAVAELYDCVAVCLRTIDVLEGRQKLGRAKGGEA